MDTRQWDIHQHNSHAQQKRPRDTDSMSAEAIPAPNCYSSHIGEHESQGEPEWKRRRHQSQQNTGNWENNVQTSLWLAQQNNLAPLDVRGQFSRMTEPERAVLRDESLQRAPLWSRHPDEAERFYGQERFAGGARGSPAETHQGDRLATRMHQPRERTLSRQAGPETASPRPRKPTNIAEMEKRCEKCSHPELLRDCTASLSQLVESVTSGALAEKLDQARRDGVFHDQTPHILELHRIFDLLQEANELAKQVLRSAPSHQQTVKRGSPLHVNEVGTSVESMKRRFLSDTQDPLKNQRRQSTDLNPGFEVPDYGLGSAAVTPDPTTHAASPRRLSSAGVASNDVLPPIRPPSPSHPLSDGYGSRLPSMKPPPTPGRQLPSPPGRSHPSPPSYNVPSPSSLLSSQYVSPASAPPPQPSIPSILHPLSPTPSSSLGATTAIQAHTAALQHEVSVKKYALQTLQSEHDKLLAALRRSQTRAHALEEKQVASDLEINTLAEERVRLLTQAQELEQSIADISKSRDEFRQATVKGGAQYVKIVRMASQLEMMAGEERRDWKRQLEEQKSTIEMMRAQSQGSRRLDFPGLSAAPSTGKSDEADDLRREIQRLRARCGEMEAALRIIRSGSNGFGETVQALSDFGEKIFDSVDKLLADGRPPLETRKFHPQPPVTAPEGWVSSNISP